METRKTSETDQASSRDNGFHEHEASASGSCSKGGFHEAAA